MEKRTEIIKKIKASKPLIDCHTHVGISIKSYLTKGYPYSQSFEDLFIRMETAGIDHAIVFPFFDSCYFKIDPNSSDIIEEAKLCNFPYELENKNLFNEIYEVFPEQSNKALPFLMFDPSRKTNEQAELFEDIYKKYPVFGLKTVPTYIQAFAGDLSTKGKPILDFARKYSLPITFHTSYYQHDPWSSVFDIVKFAEENPDIRICLAHSARFVKDVLDKASKLNNCYVDLSAFIIHCKLAAENDEHIADDKIRFPADYNNPSDVLYKIAEQYPEIILWGTDAPCYYWIQNYYDAEGNLIKDKLSCLYKDEINLMRTLQENHLKRIATENTLRFLFG